MIRLIKSMVAAFQDALFKKEKNKVIVCWGDSLTAPQQETLNQKIRGIIIENHDYSLVQSHDVAIMNSNECG